MNIDADNLSVALAKMQPRDIRESKANVTGSWLRAFLLTSFPDHNQPAGGSVFNRPQQARTTSTRIKVSAHHFCWNAIVLFAIAAAGGLVMAAIRVFVKCNPPAWLALLHGLLAGAGLTLLLFVSFTTGLPTLAICALVLLLIAAAGGLLMNLGYAWTRQLMPKPLVYGHALIAVVGFILLIVGALD